MSDPLTDLRLEMEEILSSTPDKGSYSKDGITIETQFDESPYFEFSLRAILNGENKLAENPTFWIQLTEGMFASCTNNDACDTMFRIRSGHLWIHDDISEEVRNSDEFFIVIDVKIRDSLS